MYLVKALGYATAPDIPGNDVQWTPGQTRYVHESLIQRYRNNPAAWEVVATPDATSVTSQTDPVTGVIRYWGKNALLRDILPRKLLCCTVGNSLMSGIPNHVDYACIKTEKYSIKTFGGVGGYVSAQVLSTLSSKLDTSCELVFIQEGTNDARQLTLSAAGHITNIIAIIDGCLAANVLPVVIASPPIDNPGQLLTKMYALYERIYCEDKGIPFFDPWNRFTDIDATWTATSTADGVHPTITAKHLIGDDLAAMLTGSSRSRLYPRDNLGQGIWQANVLNLTDVDANGVSDNWWYQALAGAVFTLEAASYPQRGNSQVITVTQTVTGYFYRAFSTGYAAGDILRVTGYVEMTSSNMSANLYMRSNVDVTNTYLFFSDKDVALQYFEFDYVVPSNVTTLTLFWVFASTAGGEFTGVLKFSGVDCYNLTSIRNNF